mgnify:CR=1 FL=1
MNNKGIIGAIIGDIVGSRFEFNNYRSTDFQLFNDNCFFTDDSVMTIAVADWITNKDHTQKELSTYMREWGHKYPNRGYGGMFFQWLFSRELLPAYNSFGNGSAMRVSPCGFYADSIENALLLAEQSAEVTHNHPEGIKGAVAAVKKIHGTDHLVLYYSLKKGVTLSDDDIRQSLQSSSFLKSGILY